jgi:hypothetical protein
MPASLGSSSRRFSVPSEAADKGNGKNLAAHFNLLRVSPPVDKPPAFLTAVLLRSAVRGRKLQNGRYGENIQANLMPHDAIVAEIRQRTMRL